MKIPTVLRVSVDNTEVGELAFSCEKIQGVKRFRKMLLDAAKLRGIARQEGMMVVNGAILTIQWLHTKGNQDFGSFTYKGKCYTFAKIRGEFE